MVDEVIGEKGLVHWLFVEHFKDYDNWPWMAVTNLEKQWAEHASFVVCEGTFYVLAVVSFMHAFLTTDVDGNRRLPLLWISTFIVGTVNDYIFMLLPVCDNFWQAQGLIMLTPRMPLYIPLVYNAFMYWPLVAASRVFYHSNRSRIAEACLAGLLGGLLYAPYDLNGARFLWWTWHDSDPPIALRWLGVPAGSTAWTLTFNFSLSFLMRTGADKGWSQLRTLLLACLSTPMMICVLNCFNVLGMDKFTVPGVRTLLAVLLLYGAVVLHRVWTPSGETPRPLQQAEPLAVRLALMAYFASMASCMAFFSPERVISTGAHQIYGPCEKQDLDMMLMPRNRFICEERYEAGWTTGDHVAHASGLDRKFPNNWYFRLDGCPAAQPGATGRFAHISATDALRADPEDPHGTRVASWFTICGQPHENWSKWMSAEAGLAGLGAVLFPLAFTVLGAKTTKSKRA